MNIHHLNIRVSVWLQVNSDAYGLNVNTHLGVLYQVGFHFSQKKQAIHSCKDFIYGCEWTLWKCENGMYDF